MPQRLFRRYAALATGLCLIPAAVLADPPELGLPIDCRPGVDCFVTKHLDHDPGTGPARFDFACGRKTGDNDAGTDFAIADRIAMDIGVAVLAAAPGTVLRVRADMPDRTDPTAPIEPVHRAQGCGNGIVIDHGKGWQTQYCHLKANSVRIAPGRKVERGDVIGLVGLSGTTEHPHVEFILRHEQTVIDPYTGARHGTDCRSQDTDRGLWSDTAAAQLIYRPVVLPNIGFAAERPDLHGMRIGRYRADIAPDAPALVLWTEMMGGKTGDRIEFRIAAPDGAALYTHTSELDRDLAQWHGFGGLRRKTDRWPPGAYRGRIVVDRPGGGIVAERSVKIEIR